MICSRLIWPTANLTLRDCSLEWWMTPPVFCRLAAMLAVDVYFIVRVGAIDRRETEQYLDEAEHWLTSWKGPRHPNGDIRLHQPAADGFVEVKKAVEEGRGLLHRTLWWMSAQAGLRTLYGLTLWLAWAVLPAQPPDRWRPTRRPLCCPGRNCLPASTHDGPAHLGRPGLSEGDPRPRRQPNGLFRPTKSPRPWVCAPLR